MCSGGGGGRFLRLLNNLLRRRTRPREKDNSCNSVSKTLKLTKEKQNEKIN